MPAPHRSSQSSNAGVPLQRMQPGHASGDSIPQIATRGMP
ncbi:hypothetical protein PXO_00037 [Xanthomonas oryzae pv. oryzae PXO99A]|uniref:Uncharacterized protein n=1 Tax=Xanthomonas oryzae pv. oryzae (strain PXO99A) TaxID=360094 RepID=A0A0K0GJS0_XANOP|nr:hypothetical protein PXO_00037 [Xanthomonas oryzae pv. oryzae PXO99A]